MMIDLRVTILKNRLIKAYRCVLRISREVEGMI